MAHPRPTHTGRSGRPIIYPRRDVVGAIRYLDRTGCQWNALPAKFPYHKLVYHYFKTWTVLHRIEARWTVFAVNALEDGPTRFTELKAHIRARSGARRGLSS
jgi:transposase